MMYTTVQPVSPVRPIPPRSIVVFVLLAYGLAWLPAFALHASLGALAFVGFGVSPGLAAVVVIYRHGGLTGVRSLVAVARPSTLRWRTTGAMVVGVIWFIALTRAATAALDSTSRAWPTLSTWGAATAGLPLIAIGVLLEELGWRGFLLPALQTRWSALTASLAVGAAWGCWHLPLLLQTDSPNAALPVWWYPAGAGASAVVYAAVFNATHGSVWATVVIHAAMNTLNTPFVQDRYDRGLDFTTPSAVSLAVTIALAATIVALVGGHNLATQPRTILTTPTTTTH